MTPVYLNLCRSASSFLRPFRLLIVSARILCARRQFCQVCFCYFALPGRPLPPAAGLPSHVLIFLIARPDLAPFCQPRFGSKNIDIDFDFLFCAIWCLGSCTYRTLTTSQSSWCSSSCQMPSALQARIEDTSNIATIWVSSVCSFQELVQKLK